MSEWHFGHVSQILHQVLSPVRISSGAHSGQSKQHGGPGRGIISGQHVIHVNPARSGSDQVDQEDQGDECERKSRFILSHFWELGHESG